MTSASVGSPRYTMGGGGTWSCVCNGGGGTTPPLACRLLLYLPRPCFTPDQLTSIGSSSWGSSESMVRALLLICASRGYQSQFEQEVQGVEIQKHKITFYSSICLWPWGQHVWKHEAFSNFYTYCLLVYRSFTIVMFMSNTWPTNEMNFLYIRCPVTDLSPWNQCEWWLETFSTFMHIVYHSNPCNILSRPLFPNSKWVPIPQSLWSKPPTVITEPTPK